MGGLPSGSDPTQFDMGDFGITGAGMAALPGYTQDVVQEFYNNLAKNNTTLKTMSDLVFDGLDATLGLPYAIIVGLIEKLFPWIDIPNSITELLGGLGEVPLLGDLVEALTGVLHGDLGTLGAWAGGIVGDIQQLIDNIVNGFFGTITQNNPITLVLDIIANLLGIGKSAKATADSALAGVAVLNATEEAIGTPIVDTFDRASNAQLGSNWTQTYLSGGLGTLGTNGEQDAAWKTSGGFASWCVAHHNTALSTNIQAATIVIEENIPYYSTSQHPEEWLILRCNGTNDEYVIAKIGQSWVEIGCMVGTTYTRFGARANFTGNTLGLWQLRAGVIGDDYTFTLHQGTNEVIRRTDAGHVSQIGAGHRRGGFGQYTGGEIAFFFAVQGTPPNIQTFATYDRAATA